MKGSMGLFREKFNAKAMQWVNRISGAVITAFGALVLIIIFG